MPGGMRFACLGSGSGGNSMVVEAGRTRVLLDCGFGIREMVSRLARLALVPEDLCAIVVTHEHSDHIGGVAKFAAKFNLSVWLTHGTLSAAASRSRHFPRLNLIDSHTPFSIEDIRIEPFPVPHDAREPAQYIFGDGDKRLGVMTDAGASTAHIEATLKNCDALVLECNHDAEMLRNGPYPPMLKRRVAGRLGHLDNEAAAGLLARLDHRRLQHVVAAHLSEKNNTPALARQALARVLGCEPEWIGVAEQEGGFGWRQIG